MTAVTVLVAVAVIQREHVVSAQLVQRQRRQIVLQQVVLTRVMVHPVPATHVVAVVDVLQVKSKIAMATVVQKHGLQMAIVMTALTIGMVFQFT